MRGDFEWDVNEDQPSHIKQKNLLLQFVLGYPLFWARMTGLVCIFDVMYVGIHVLLLKKMCITKNN